MSNQRRSCLRDHRVLRGWRSRNAYADRRWHSASVHPPRSRRSISAPLPGVGHDARHVDGDRQVRRSWTAVARRRRSRFVPELRWASGGAPRWRWRTDSPSSTVTPPTAACCRLGVRAPVNIPPTLVGGVVGIDAFPPIRFAPTLRMEVEQQLTAVNALAWVSYALSSRIDLILPPGARSTGRAWRGVSGSSRSFCRDFLPGCPPFEFYGPSTRVVNYGVGPVVGVETRIALGDHVRVVPALRMSSAFAGWSVRPTAGIAWMF